MEEILEEWKNTSSRMENGIKRGRRGYTDA